MANDPASTGRGGLGLLIRVSGPAVYLIVLAAAPKDLPAEARQTLAVAAWMIAWWLTEAVPLAATSLLPIVLFPLLGVRSVKEAAAPYANELIFLFLAGFLLAAALAAWNAHTRIALAIVAAIGSSARRIVLGVMVATAFISMWISNTATAAMMYPIALATGALFGDGADAARLRTALMLGVAYAASIGGMATLIGTPPNLVFAAAAANVTGEPVGFLSFMAIGLPIAAVLLPLCWGMLMLLFPARVALDPAALRLIGDRRANLGLLRGGEAMTIGVFALAALAWIGREPKQFGTTTVPGLADLAPSLSDASIGVAAAIVLFVLTGKNRDGVRRPLLTWSEAREIPWEVLLLFGGGLSLAAAMEDTGATQWIGGAMSGLAELPAPVVYAGLAAIVLVLSEIASNTAVAAMAMPLAAGLAPAVGLPPVTLMLVAALAASTGFALPVATPPNAIVYGSGQIGVRDMARAGCLLDVLAVAVIVMAVWLLGPVVGR